MMKTFLIFLTFIAFLAPAAHAQEAKPVLLELFTTQGCSSCPVADALVKQLTTEDPKLITLACHVNYFDDESWKDTLYKPLCTERQKAYGEKLDMTVATPTIVINGQYPVIGARENTVRAGIKMARSVDSFVDIQVSKRENILDITLPAASLDEPVDVLFVATGPAEDVAIGGGENNGKTIHYTNPVRYMFKLFSWDGTYKTKSVPLDIYPAARYGIIVQKPDTGAVLGAALTD